MRAIDDLKTEHELIGRVLTILEAEVKNIEGGAAPRPEMLSDALAFIRGFADRCHHGKEERHLFPALAEKSDALRLGPVSVMLLEHDEGRGYAANLEAAIAGIRGGKPEATQAARGALQRYCRMLRNHIDKEENVLFPIAAEVLSTEEASGVAIGFDAVEDEMGAAAHERFHALVEKMETATT